MIFLIFPPPPIPPPPPHFYRFFPSPSPSRLYCFPLFVLLLISIVFPPTARRVSGKRISKNLFEAMDIATVKGISHVNEAVVNFHVGLVYLGKM